MIAGTWAKKLSLVLLGAAMLTVGVTNISTAQTITNTFDPPDPGATIPNSGGLTFNGFVSATGGAGGGVAASNGTATVSPLPPATLFNFFGVSLSKPTGSNVNFIQIQGFLGGSTLYTQTVDISAGSQSFRPSSLGLPVTVSSLTFTGFATSPTVSSLSARSFSSEPTALFASTLSFSDPGELPYYEDPYYEDPYGSGGGYGGGGYGGHRYGGGYHHGKKKKKNIKLCGYKDCSNVFFIDDLETAAVPEPTTMLGLLIASGGLVALKRKHGQKKAD